MGLDKDRRGAATEALPGPRQWLLPVAVVVLSLVFEVAGDELRVALRYSRPDIADGEAWRLLSGHFVHLGWGHWSMNALALVAIWALVGSRLGAGGWLLAILVTLLVIDAGFWWFDPALHWYVGLSGLLHGLLLAGLVAGWRDTPREATLLAALLVAKLAWEQLAGPLPGSAAAAGGPVVVNSHLYGAAGGLLAGLVLVSVRRAPSL